MAQEDERQLRVLGVLHYAYSAVLGFGALYSIVLLTAGLSTLGEPAPSGGMEDVSMGFGAMFVAMGAVGLFLAGALAIATVAAGKRLKRGTHRTYCLVVAAINSLWVPIGTVLGIVTIVTLMRPSVVGLFERAAGGSEA